MKVHQLVELLMACDPNADVETEGCDCIGQAASVSQDSQGTVCINRGLDGEWPGKAESERRTAAATLAYAEAMELARASARERHEDWLRRVEELEAGVEPEKN